MRHLIALLQRTIAFNISITDPAQLSACSSSFKLASFAENEGSELAAPFPKSRAVVTMLLQLLRLRAPAASGGFVRFSTLNTQLSVRNAAAAGTGRLHLQLPLPGIAGLSVVHVDDAAASVQMLIDAIKRRDASLKSVEVTTANGTKLARTVRLSELSTMEFILRLNSVNILVQNGACV